MSRKSAPGVLFRQGVYAGIALSALILFTTPARAQRGQRGGGAPHPRSMPMPMPRMAPPPMARMPRAPMSMPRPAPMPRPEPPMARPAPPPVRQPQPEPTRPAVRNPHPAPAQQRNTNTQPGEPSPSSPAFTLGSGRRPAYTPITSAKQLMASQRALASSNFHPYSIYTQPLWFGFGWDAYSWSGFGWGGLGWNPLMCGPFQLSYFSNNPAFLANYYTCFDPAAYYSLFGYNPFFNNFGFGPFSSTSFLFGAGNLGPNCLLCSSYGYDPFTFGMYNSLAPDPYMPTLGSSVNISNGDLPGLLPSTSVPEPSSATTGEAPSYSYVKPSSTNQTITLVLTDGTKIQASQYKLAANGMFHYVTTTGQAEEIPFSQVDIKATMQANPDKGVDFLVPTSQQPQPQPQTKLR